MSDYFLITNSKCRRQNGIADIALSDDIKHLKFEIKSKFSEIDREMKVYQRKSQDLDVVKKDKESKDMKILKRRFEYKKESRRIGFWFFLIRL